MNFLEILKELVYFSQGKTQEQEKISPSKQSLNSQARQDRFDAGVGLSYSLNYQQQARFTNC
jgi:hypothetical protein